MIQKRSSLENLLAIVATVARLVLGPSFSSRVTGPLASVQVISKGVPSVTAQLELVKATRARTWEMVAEKARRRAANCILARVVDCTCGIRDRCKVFNRISLG